VTRGAAGGVHLDGGNTVAAGPVRVRLALITVQLLFGVNYLASKLVVDVLDPGAWAALRALASLVILAALAGLGRRRLPRGRDAWYLAGCALLGVTLNQILFLEGLSRTTPAHSALICCTIPLFTLVAAALLRQESLTGRKLLGLLIGMSGVLVLLEVDRFSLDAQYLVGDLLTLINAVCYGFYVALSRRVMARHDTLGATTVVFAWGTLGVMLYGGLALWQAPLASLPATILGAMAFAIVGATVITYTLNLWALKHTHASRVALYVFLQPVVATVLAVLLLFEPVTWRLLLAGALVLASLSLRAGRGRPLSGTTAPPWRGKREE
jgi:drug/metabolite transporter (DMT)-like permease